jgi:hydrogenase/urease accessory protein HupE
VLRWHDSTARLLGEHHRTITSIQLADTAHGAVRREYLFDRDNTEVVLELGKAPEAHTAAFLVLGFRHILEGLDHLLFLTALLLGRRDLRGLLLTVTTFTAAHSASLAASALGVVHASAAWVEPVVAASVIWASLANLAPRAATVARQAITFIFGLVHGLAFSEALVPLDLAGWALARALLGFNLGVEVAQALLVTAFVPLIDRIARRMPRRRLEVALSLCIAAVGTVWLIQRLPPS